MIHQKSSGECGGGGWRFRFLQLSTSNSQTANMSAQSLLPRAYSFSPSAAVQTVLEETS